MAQIRRRYWPHSSVLLHQSQLRPRSSTPVFDHKPQFPPAAVPRCCDINNGKTRYDSLGLTGFYDYGYSNKCTPDLNATNATCGHLARAAALVHYTAETWGVIAEWDYGHKCVQSC